MSRYVRKQHFSEHEKVCFDKLRSGKKNPLKRWCYGRQTSRHNGHHFLKAIGQVCSNSQNGPELDRSRPLYFYYNSWSTAWVSRFRIWITFSFQFGVPLGWKLEPWSVEISDSFRGWSRKGLDHRNHRNHRNNQEAQTGTATKLPSPRDGTAHGSHSLESLNLSLETNIVKKSNENNAFFLGTLQIIHNHTVLIQWMIQWYNIPCVWISPKLARRFCACPVEECLAMRCHRQAPEAVPPVLGSQQPSLHREASLAIQISQLLVADIIPSKLNRGKQNSKMLWKNMKMLCNQRLQRLRSCSAAPGTRKIGWPLVLAIIKAVVFFQHSQDSIKFTTLVN